MAAAGPPRGALSGPRVAGGNSLRGSQLAVADPDRCLRVSGPSPEKSIPGRPATRSGGPFASFILLVAILLSSHYSRYLPPWGAWLCMGFIAALAIVAAQLLAHWVTSGVSIQSIHPGYLLPVVPGFFVASIGFSSIHARDAAMAAFGIGGRPAWSNRRAGDHGTDAGHAPPRVPQASLHADVLGVHLSGWCHRELSHPLTTDLRRPRNFRSICPFQKRGVSGSRSFAHSVLCGASSLADFGAMAVGTVRAAMTNVKAVARPRIVHA
ncbi:hypothetical protein QFZ23_002267 [Arthrobacter globiformis]|nr:hypothetical protein [Arthrobacter globiformis]